MKSLRSLALVVVVLNAAFAVAVNPTPFINQPLIPASVAPGGPTFTLTVNGTGFVSGSTLNWNGSPRTTTFVNASQLTATILSTDIASASTASVTVVSPTPGGGTSNVVFLTVREPAGFVSLNATSFNPQATPSGLVTGDFNHDGKQDLAVGSLRKKVAGLVIWLGNGDGTFQQRGEYQVGGTQTNSMFLATGDVNNDGNLDLIVLRGGEAAFWVLLGNGDGSFQPPAQFTVAGEVPTQAILGDFNRDGALDSVFLLINGFCIALGNGNGSFQPATCTFLKPNNHDSIVIGDFNLDGNLDIALGSTNTAGLTVALGNGDGTFRTPRAYQTGFVIAIAAADFNSDGKLDLATIGAGRNSVKILLGDGDGNFTQFSSVAAGSSPGFITTGDLNGDGKLDLITGNAAFDAVSISVILGNGDGTFQNHNDFGGSKVSSLVLADFNNDGRLDVATSSATKQAVIISTQDNGTVVSLSPGKLQFPTELVDNVSDPRIVRLTNTGTSAINISKVQIDSSFSQLNNCHTVQPAGFCRIAVFFTPTQPGELLGYVTVSDTGGGSPQRVALAGTGTVVSFSPSQIDFGNLQVGKFSAPEKVTLTNEGTGTLSIKGIAISGDNASDFSQVNACPGQLTAGASCTITVIFHPQAQGLRTAAIEVNDDGGGSPQKVPLTGTGT